MKYKNTLKMILSALLKKRAKSKKIVESIIRLSESKELQKKKDSSIAPQDKRKKLKEIYAKILTGTEFEDNIPIFTQMIDQVPDDYVEYELGINLDKALTMVKELTLGTGNFTDGELKNIMNITTGIGIPAIEKHAASKEKMGASKEFGSSEINKNVDELLSSLEKRRDPRFQLAAPEPKGIVPVSKQVVRPDAIVPIIQQRLGKILSTPRMNSNSEFWKLAQSLKVDKGINMERLAKSFANIISNSDNYEEAKKKAKKAHPSLDFSKGEDFFHTFWNAKKQEEVRK